MTTWIENLIADAGYTGIAFLMFLENLFPPIPSEVIMPLAGYTAAGNSSLSLFGVIAAGSVGSTIGMTFWYYVGLWFSEDRLRNFAVRHGRWLTLSRGDIAKIDTWFDKGGRWAILIGRCVPTIRTLISIPAGIFAMPLKIFLPLTLAGVTVWNAGLAWIGYSLGDNYDVIDQYLGPVSLAIILLIVAGYIYRVFTFPVAKAS